MDACSEFFSAMGKTLLWNLAPCHWLISQVSFYSSLDDGVEDISKGVTGAFEEVVDGSRPSGICVEEKQAVRLGIWNFWTENMKIFGSHCFKKGLDSRFL